jgi:hypothetical protein
MGTKDVKRAKALELKKHERMQSIAMTFVESTKMAAELFDLDNPVPADAILHSATPYYAPDPLDQKPGFIDLSVYNGRMDYAKMTGPQAVPIDAIYARAGMSWAYEDPTFGYNFENATTNKLSIMPYFVLFPSQDVKRQVDHWSSIVAKYDWERPWASKTMVIDLELYQDQGSAIVMRKTYEAIQMFIEQNPDWKVIIYSAFWFLSEHAEFQPWVTDVDWILAHYLAHSVGREHPGPPARPAWLPAENVIGQQTSDYVDAIPYGATGDGNLRMDFNRWFGGDKASLLHYLRTGEVITLPPDDHLDIWNAIQMLRDNQANLTKRVTENERKLGGMYDALK